MREKVMASYNEKEGTVPNPIEGGKKQVVEREREEEEELKPWEQHAAVISIPRYDYRAPSSLVHRSHSGFLITCPIKREKSATKEVIPILEEYVSSVCNNGGAVTEFCTTDSATKKRKLCSMETNEENVDNAGRSGDDNISEISGKVAGDIGLLSSEAGENAKNSCNLSLVKLTRSGLLLFTFPNNEFPHIIDVLSNVVRSLGSGNLKRPLWCNRIFPIQETCILTEKDLQIVVTKLVKQYLGNEQEEFERPVKFAVAYNRRGIDETELKNTKSTVQGTNALALLEREHCFKIVAGAFKDVAKNSIVDLKSPEVAVFVEVLPISGVPLESIVSGVSILPHELFITKPRLCVRPLVLDSKPAKKKV